MPRFKSLEFRVYAAPDRLKAELLTKFAYPHYSHKIFKILLSPFLPLNVPCRNFLLLSRKIGTAVSIFSPVQDVTPSPWGTTKRDHNSLRERLQWAHDLWALGRQPLVFFRETDSWRAWEAIGSG